MELGHRPLEDGLPSQSMVFRLHVGLFILFQGAKQSCYGRMLAETPKLLVASKADAHPLKQEAS